VISPFFSSDIPFGAIFQRAARYGKLETPPGFTGYI
jgi:hypothetical protein